MFQPPDAMTYTRYLFKIFQLPRSRQVVDQPMNYKAFLLINQKYK